MKPIRTIIVDDEVLARKRIRNLLKEDAEVAVIAECINGKQALAAILARKPELIFLDIQMPDLDGFGVLNKLPLQDRPFIIFVTAHNHFALKAFEYHALDYLLKPFRNQRFAESLAYAKNHLRQRSKAQFSDKLLDFIQEEQSATPATTIEVKVHNSRLALKAQDICFVRADGNYVRIYVEDDYYLQRLTLQEIEQNLDPQQFIRVHRSIIVNRFFVEAIDYIGNNEYQVRMQNGHEFTSGRHYKEKLAELGQA